MQTKFDWSKITILGYTPLAFNSPDGVVPLGDLRKFFTEGSGMAKYQMA